MNRRDAIAALLSAQSKPVTKLDAPSASRNYAGLTDTVGDTSFSRVRDRATISTQEIAAPKPKSEREKLIDLYAADHERQKAAQAAAEAERARKEAERIAAERQARLNAEAQRKAVREAQERQSQVLQRNMTRSEIKSILKDASAEEMSAVLRLVREWRTEQFAPSYMTALEQVRQQHERRSL